MDASPINEYKWIKYCHVGMACAINENKCIGFAKYGC